MSEHEWVVECVAQFLRSPLWTTPVHDFIDEHCILFSGTSDAGSGPQGEQSLEHTAIHHKFRELVDGLITEYIEELGVPPEDVLRACETTASEDGARFLEYMYALDRYETFVLLMARRNAELEAEALRQLNASVSRATVSTTGSVAPDASADVSASKSAAPEAPPADEADEEAALKAAIEASLQDATAAQRREAELEDEELQRALQLSLAMEEQRKARDLELRKLEEEAAADSRKAAAATEAVAAAAPATPAPEAPPAPATQPEKKSEEQIEAESQQRQEAIKAAVHQARVENAERSVAPPAPAQKPAEADGAPSPLAGASPTQRSPQHEGGAPAAAPAPEAKPEPAAPAPTTAVPAAQPKPGLGALRSGRSGAMFPGFSKLPAIGSTPAPAAPPTFDELRSQAAQSKGEAAPPAPPSESEEVIRQRAEHMRRQREKLHALKKQQRQEELEKFKSEQQQQGGTAPQPASDGKPHADAAHQDLTRQLARRFRTDIASAAKN